MTGTISFTFGVALSSVNGGPLPIIGGHEIVVNGMNIDSVVADRGINPTTAIPAVPEPSFLWPSLGILAAFLWVSSLAKSGKWRTATSRKASEREGDLRAQ
jgi:hypothetical protein